MSTLPNEIVTCRWPHGRKFRVFIKFEAGPSDNSFGHRSDLPYEATVYQRVLKSLPDFRPKYLGAHTEPRSGDTSLFLEYAYRNRRLSEIGWEQPRQQFSMMAKAAGWAAQFHDQHEGRMHDPDLSFLKRYDAAYYRGWARRTFELARPLQPRFPWLADLAECGDAWFAPLLAAPQTVIHGEFYAKSVLVRGQNLFVVDWESTAIGPGEIDLAALTDGKGWPAKLVPHCEKKYQLVRWSDGAPFEFQRTLVAARVYFQFRWLAEQLAWTPHEKTISRFERLRVMAKLLGLI